jgi:predicted DNA-binding transcriptional regulator YafY
MGSHKIVPGTRNGQLVRILRILHDLDRLDGVDLYALAERYGTTPRTIRRDFDALQEAGFPLVQVAHGRRLRWQLNRTPQTRRMSGLLNAGHLLALKVAQGQGTAVAADSGLLAQIEDLEAKIEAAVGKKGRQQLADVEACFFSYEKGAYMQAPADVLWPLVSAIVARQICEVSYRAPKHRGRQTHFDILPLKLFVYQGAVYLMCHILKHDTLASLNLQRLTALHRTSRVAQPPQRFDPALLEMAAFGVWTGGEPTEYSLSFDAEAAPYIKERRWSPTQVMEPLPDGGLGLKFTCSASVEVEAWVASWRQHVQVLAPVGLQESLFAFACWAHGRYGAGRTQVT